MTQFEIYYQILPFALHLFLRELPPIKDFIWPCIPHLVMIRIEFTVWSLHHTIVLRSSSGNPQGAREREGWRVLESHPGACTCTITSIPWYVYWASVMAMVPFHRKMPLFLNTSSPYPGPETLALMTTGTAAAVASPVSAAGSASYINSLTSLSLSLY